MNSFALFYTLPISILTRSNMCDGNVIAVLHTKALQNIVNGLLYCGGVGAGRLCKLELGDVLLCHTTDKICQNQYTRHFCVHC